MICVTDLTKRYGETLALDRLSVKVPEGAVFGLLGPNGAGKTTLLRLLMGFAFADSGEIERAGLPPSRIGYLPERAFFPPRFTINSHLTTIGKLAGLRGEALSAAVSQRLQQFGLERLAGQRLGACSRGMLQRLGIAQALIANPPLLLFDEPALGLDPAAQKFMREQIVALHQEGKTIILSSHDLDEVTRICSHVAVVHQGRLVRSGPLDALLAPRPQVTITTGPLPKELVEQLVALSDGITVSSRTICLSGKASHQKATILGLLLNSGVDVKRLLEQQASLEEIYLEATGG